MYQVIGHPQTRAIRLMWMLEELGEAYEVAPFPPASEAMKRINASGKSPVLGDGKLMIPDSMAGCVYLADKHGRLGYPAGTAERARLDSLMFLILDEIEGPLWTKAKHSFALPEKLRVPEMKAVAEKEFRRGLANLAARLGTSPYLTGENFTYADILLGHCAAWGAVAGFPAPEDEALAGLIERIRARPSLAAAEARRNEILASQKAHG